MQVVSGEQKDNTLVKVLTNRVLELEKFQEVRMQAAKTNGIQELNRALWSQQKNLEKQFNFGDYA